MSSDLIGLSYGSGTGTSLGTLASSSKSSTVSAASSSDDDSSGSPGIQGDGKNFSNGAEMMQKLKNLQSSDPDKFKEVAQKISNSLSDAAKNSSDSQAAGMYSDMAGKFAQAAKSGSMSSLGPSEPPSNASGAQGQAAMKYAAHQSGGGNPMENVDSIISGALSGVGASEA
ncbi:conserved hypothetical protein [Solidesulfovibrio fructosivorans JJ]]|uniref:Uncharacterized protein n=1 Tax=Solidesulfovibrio fructosivorans JJ] TaxID=596151 RepID=E1JZY5_SOLFR|nr:hypothetical protein [Solidesulfovibrio fructosivorans]EFL50080.1 conserved hypothetical protein [Solidesulfovibrio fructosivorans JJ]]